MATPEQLEAKRIYSREWRARNRERHRAYQRDYVVRTGYKRISPPEEQRRSHYKRMGITPQRYDELLELQGGGCALCGRKDPGVGRLGYFCVDHDHTTGRIRGLLCVGCNISLGYFERGWRSRLGPEKARAYLG